MEALQSGYRVKLSLFPQCNFHDLGINFYHAKIKGISHGTFFQKLEKPCP
jgi:hypothetical protein